MEGSSAQEECLCHTSNLYNVLKRFPKYYEWNKKHNNKALYTNRAMYSENVTFLDESVCVYGADPIHVKLMSLRVLPRIILPQEDTQELNWTKTMRSYIGESSLYLTSRKRTM